MPYRKRGQWYYRDGKKYSRKQIEAIFFAKKKRKQFGKKKGK